MTIQKYARGLIWGFRREERGSTAVETVIMLPLLFWTWLALFATFHAFRTYAINQKAAYTIGDMISRETNPLDASYMIGAKDLLQYLTAGAPGDLALRVTAVQYDAASDTYVRAWSQAEGYLGAASKTEVESWKSRLPIMPDGEFVMVVETHLRYDPPFNTGLINREIKNFVFTKPRYAPQVLFDTGA
ncbi:MAG: TadE/TadG family type IV pilus assembly protein [Paracoccaceae bacterium]